MAYIILKVLCVLFVCCVWYILFGLECYMNGLSTRNSLLLPFAGLKQDLTWINRPDRSPEGFSPMWAILMHSMPILSVILAFKF